MNSPLPGRSSTANVTSRMTVRSPNRFVTLLELDDVRRHGRGGLAHVSPRPRDTGNSPRWNQNSSAVDAVREQADDDQDQDDVLRQPAPLARHQQVAEPVLRVDQLGQHDVAERQAEQVAQAVVDVGQRQRHQHLRHDLQRRRAERLRGLDVAIRHAGDRARRRRSRRTARRR